MNYKVSVWALLALLALVLSLVGCAGNGKGLDENGNPIGTGGGGGGLPVAFEPTFTNIQQNVFNSICIQCHIGAAAPQGLILDEQNSYNLLVNILSNERPDLFRVESGNPDNSYLIRKLEGGPEIAGAQMPLNLTPLSQETINAIRVWISQGAQRN
jgi:hypothetical protein